MRPIGSRQARVGCGQGRGRWRNNGARRGTSTRGAPLQKAPTRVGWPRGRLAIPLALALLAVVGGLVPHRLPAHPGGTPSAPPASPPPADLLPTGLGLLLSPAPGAQVVTAFGWVQRAGRPMFQPYVYMEVPPGSALRTVASGVVTTVGDDVAGPGLYVLVAHARKWSSLYGGCGTVLVYVGERLGRGAPACAAQTGPAPAGVAFGLQQNGHPVDPAPYVSLDGWGA